LLFGAILLNEEVSLKSIIWHWLLIGGSITAATDVEDNG